MDVNAVITNLCDADPILGAPESMPEYHTEAKVYVPNESVINLAHQINDPLNFSQTNVPFLQGRLFKSLYYFCILLSFSTFEFIHSMLKYIYFSFFL